MSHTAPNAVVEEQKVVVENKHGEKLAGLLNDTGSSEIVILCHGFRANKERPLMVSLAAALQKQGISVFRFDFSGNGESEGSLGYGDYAREVDDLRAVIEYFSSKGRTIRAILGHSKGADVVLLYASRFKDVPKVVNVSGRYNLRRIAEPLGDNFMEKLKENGFIDVEDKKGIYRITEESMADRLSTDIHSACQQIEKECRVLTVHGSNDTVIPVEDAEEFAKIIPNHKLSIIKGANHGYTSQKAKAKLVSAVVDFIKLE